MRDVRRWTLTVRGESATGCEAQRRVSTRVSLASRAAVRHGLLAAVALATMAACGAPAPGQPRKLVVIAVDGLEPDVTERLMRAGRLPNMSALAHERRVVRVTPTPGADGASAWASFATGINPGGHGIFDLVAPDSVDGSPRVSTLVSRPSERWLGRWWSEGPAYAQVRQGSAFWTRLGESGVRSRLLFVPGTFPPEPVPHGEMIAGSPLPDLHGGLGGYTWLGTDVAADRTGVTRFGGRIVRLSFERNVAEAEIPGIRTPIVQDLPITIVWNPEARSANITIADTFVHLDEGQRSRWLEVSLAMNAFTRVDGLVQLHLIKAGNDVELYVSPVQWHPHRPPSAIAEPQEAAAALFDRLGIYRTLAWPGAGWALLDGRANEAEFLHSVEETFNDRAAAIMNTVGSGGWDLVVAGIEVLDVTQHLLWRLVDPGHDMYDAVLSGQHGKSVEEMYIRVDELVGQVRAALPGEAALVVVSAYGTYTARHVVDLNRWLLNEGLLAWSETPSPVSLAALTDPTLRHDNIDWSSTRARAMGSGHVYVNLRGRDPHGIVSPGEEYEALLARLKSGLEALTDPISGRRVVSRVRKGHEVYTGPYADKAPDLVVSFSPGYTVSWDTRMGGAAGSVIARNHERWSAEHASVDEHAVPGAWLSSLPLSESAISVLDIAPTVEQYFGLAPGAGSEGTARLAAVQPAAAAVASASRR
jgi:predicted AlkP superfamily phosphohydrolase/phosphomutase